MEFKENTTLDLCFRMTSWHQCENWKEGTKSRVQIRSVAQSCPTVCDPMNRSMPGLPVHHELPEFTETHVHLVKAMVFPVVMYGCESWSIKKAEHQRIDAFELWCWRRLLRVPWTARRSNQSILKEISPECSLGGLMLTLKLQYFGHLI